MIHIVTSFNLIHNTKFQELENILNSNRNNLNNDIKNGFDSYFTGKCTKSLFESFDKKIYLNQRENIIKQEFYSYLYNKNEELAEMSFKNNLENKNVKKVHNLISKKSIENLSISNDIKLHDKYVECVFDHDIMLNDIINYINTNIDDGDLVLLCDGNYYLDNSNLLDELDIQKNSVLFLQSLFEFTNGVECTYINKKTCDTFMIQTPLILNSDYNFEYFNVNNTDRVIKHICKLSNYDVKKHNDYILHAICDKHCTLKGNNLENIKYAKKISKQFHIVTSFNIIHDKCLSIDTGHLSGLNNDVQKYIKRSYSSYLYDKTRELSTQAFLNNLGKSCVKRVHNLMQKTYFDKITIPDDIKTHEKYTEQVYDEKLELCDIYEYINSNINEGDTVLLCNGNYCIGDSEEWDFIDLDNNEAYCLSSVYKYVGADKIMENKYPFADDLLVGTDIAESALNVLYGGLLHHAFMFNAPLECMIFDEFNFFNTKGVNKIMNHLFKVAGEYDLTNPSVLNSYVLYNDENNNYQDIDNDCNELINAMNIDTYKYLIPLS